MQEDNPLGRQWVVPCWLCRGGLLEGWPNGAARLQFAIQVSLLAVAEEAFTGGCQFALQALETGGWLDDAGGRRVEFDEPSESCEFDTGLA